MILFTLLLILLVSKMIIYETFDYTFDTFFACVAEMLYLCIKNIRHGKVLNPVTDA